MRTVAILALAQFFGAFGQVATVLLAGLVGAALAPDPALATLPVGTAVIGVAAATLPVGTALGRWGRRPVLLAGAAASTVGCLLGAWALALQDFGLYCVATLVVGANLAFTAQYRFAAAQAHAAGGRPLGVILGQPPVRVAMAAAAIAYGVMALLMTATPISMHVHHGHSVEDTAFVLQSHVIGMYAPSFLTGALVARFGVLAVVGWRGLNALALAMLALLLALLLAGRRPAAAAA